MFFPLYVSESNVDAYIRVSNDAVIIHPVYMPVSRSGNVYYTALPDSILFLTSSQSQSTTQTLPGGVNAYRQRIPNSLSRQVNSIFYLLGTKTAVATSGPTIDAFFNGVTPAVNVSIASTATALTRGLGGTQDAIWQSVAAGLAVANTTYPTTIQGVISNSQTQNIVNYSEALVQIASENTDRVAINSGSLYINRFIAYSSSVSPITGSRMLIISESNVRFLPTGSQITSSILFPTNSLWISQSLAADVSTTSATVYTNIFTLTGLTNNRSYLVNLYIIGRTALTTTGFRMRVITGSNYLGSLFTPTSTTAYAIQNSADANNITSTTAAAWPTNNTNFLVYGEYTFTKTSDGNPMIQLISEVAGSAVTAGSGSVVFYREIS